MYLFLVLAANSGVGTRLVVQLTDAALPGSLSVEDLSVHPALNRVRARTLVLRDPEGREVISADTFRCEIRITPLLLGRVQLQKCQAANGRVLVQEQRDGRIGIAAAFTKLDRNKAPRFEQTALHFNNVDLYNVDVLVNLGDLALLFEDTHAVDANISVANDGFDMSAERILSRGGRIHLSERLLGFGPGPSNAETLAWEIQRRQDPWKAMAVPYPETRHKSRGALDLPIHHFDMHGVLWQREEVRLRAASLAAADIEALVRGWIQFLPETPNLAKTEQGVISFDGLAQLKFTADSPFLDFILPDAVRTALGVDPAQTMLPMTLETYGNIRFAEGAANFAIRDADVMGWPLERFDGRVSLHEGQLKLHPGASAYMWDGLITGEANFEPRTGLWSARACMEQIDFEIFAKPLRVLIAGDPPDWMQAKFSTQPSRCLPGREAGLVLHGDLTSKAGFMRDPARLLPPDRPTQDPMLVADRIAAQIEWRHGIENTPLRRAQIEGAGFLDQRGVFHIDPAQGLTLQGAGARLLAHGRFDTMKSTLSDLRADIQINPLRPWLIAAGVESPPEHATLRAQLNLGGTIGAPEAKQAKIQLRIPAGEILFPELNANFTLREDGNGHRIEDFEFESPVGGLDVEGRVELFHDRSLMRPIRDPNIDLRIHGDMLDLGLIPLDTDTDGRLVSGDFHLRGRVSKPRLDGRFLFDNVRVAGESFDIVQGELSNRGADILLQDLEIIRGKGRIRGNAHYNTRSKILGFQAEGRRLRLREFAALRGGEEVDGTLRFDLDVEGTLKKLSVKGSTIIDNLQIQRRQLGSAVLAWDTEGGEIRGTGLIGKDLNVSIVAPTSLQSARVEGWFRRFPFTHYLPELSEAFEGSHVTGELFADIGLNHRGNSISVREVDAALLLDDLHLWVGDRALVLGDPACAADAATCPRPTVALSLIEEEGKLEPTVTLSDIAVGADGHFIAMAGTLSAKAVALHALGDLDLALLRLLPDLIVDAEGIARVKIDADGPLDDPNIRGQIMIQDALIAPRGLGTTLTIDHVVMLVDGETVTIPSDPNRRLVGTLFNGDIGVSGVVGLRGFIPDSFDLSASITSLAYRIPNELNITLNADVQLAAQEISDSTSWSLGGDIEIVDGRYYRDFNILSDAFNIGGIGRSVEVFSQPIWQTNPIIRDLQTNLNISGRDRLKIVSTIANAELHLELKTDLHLMGPLGRMNLTGEMTLLDKSRVYYGDRRFDVSDGALLFDGYLDDQGFPWPFMDTRLETEFKSRCASRRRGTLDASQTQSTLVRSIDANPTIYMQVEVQGRLPLDMTFNMESRPFYDQRDQLSLIVTGCSVDELTTGDGSAPTLELVFRPVISIVEQSVEERFNIDDVDLIPTPGGNADILVEDEVSERLTWTLDATVGAGDATRQALSGRLTIRNGLQLELLQQSNATTPFSLNGGLRFRWRLE